MSKLLTVRDEHILRIGILDPPNSSLFTKHVKYGAHAMQIGIIVYLVGLELTIARGVLPNEGALKV